MSERAPTRAEILARIAQSSRDQVTLEEMQRTGFWPADQAQPTPEAALIQRETELQRTLSELSQELHTRGDPERALAQMRKERMAQAKAKREEIAQRHARERYERATAHFENQKTQIHYLGAGVSHGLWPTSKAEQRPETTAHRTATPPYPLASALDLAKAMGIALAELKFLAYHRDVAEVSHYRRFGIAKKTGGTRWISAPQPRLKRAQYWVLDNILAKVPIHPTAHGFVPQRSIVSNAQAHVRQAVVINLDLKDFFPSIKFPRIKGVFRHLGYDEAVATVLALLCSENVCDEMRVDGQRFFVGHAARDRQLPQGAPTSPMLTNILCRTLDKRLSGLAQQLGFTYTRYADDLTFSSANKEQVGTLLRRAKWIIAQEGLTVHPDKQAVMHRGEQQQVTGLVVNESVAVPRVQRRKLRAALHQAAKALPAAPTPGSAVAQWEGQTTGAQTLLGYANFVNMVQPKQGQKLRTAALALLKSQSTQPSPSRATMASAKAYRRSAAQGQAPHLATGTSWWQVAERAAPALEKTAGQLREERLQRLRQERLQRDIKKGRARPERQARTDTTPVFSQAQDASFADHAPVSASEMKKRLVITLLCFGAALLTRSSTIFFIAVAWAAYGALSRNYKKTHLWLIALGVILIVAFLKR